VTFKPPPDSGTIAAPDQTFKDEDSWDIRITSVGSSEPAFGTGLGSIALAPSLLDLFSGTATLPLEPPTTPTNPSRGGQGIVINFPNGASLQTNDAPGALSVSFDGLTLSNSLDPAIQNETWSCHGVTSGVLGFTLCPTCGPGGSPDYMVELRFKSWSLTRSAL